MCGAPRLQCHVTNSWHPTGSRLVARNHARVGVVQHHVEVAIAVETLLSADGGWVRDVQESWCVDGVHSGAVSAPAKRAAEARTSSSSSAASLFWASQIGIVAPLIELLAMLAGGNKSHRARRFI